jgi:hypothetical protein
VNTHAEYRRQSYRPPEQTPPVQGSEAATSALAHYGDPSLAAGAKAPTAKGIAWVRPTELATYAAPMVGRGIDLQSELVRRARRSPTTTTRALHRGVPYSASPRPPVNRTEGPAL